MNRPFVFSILPLLFLSASAAAAPRVVLGITEPYMDVQLSTPVQGTVHVQHFDEGAEVEEGKVILELDSKLEELETQRRREVMERNQSDFEATKTLFERTKAVSKEEFDKRRMEFNVSVAEFGIAEEQLKRRKIVAPFSGSIVEITLQPGASCEPYQPLVRLADTKRCFFVGHIEGTAAAGLKVGQEVKIEVVGVNEAVVGTLAFISPVVDSASGLARVKAIFENAEGTIRPGLAAKMILE
jgi:RND family efflux transporter MFP subunit